jgi:hypothetical protein
MLSEKDEGSLSSKLRASRFTLQHGIVYAKNPILAALTVSAAFRERALVAETIKADLLKIGADFARIAVQLMRAEALDDETVAIELLTAEANQHQIDTAFEAGALCVALQSHDGDFIAQPVVQRLIDQIWVGGNWSLVEFKKFVSCCTSNTEFYNFITLAPEAVVIDGEKVKQSRPVAHVSTMIPLFREVAHPSKMRRVPLVNFYYETALGFIFIGLSIDKIIAGADMKSENMDALLVFIIGNMMYEAGQISEDPFEYIQDVWNRMDLTIYIIFAVWFFTRYTNETNWYWIHRSQQVLALNGFMMCFRLLHVVRMNKQLGPLVLMVLKMFRSVFSDPVSVIDIALSDLILGCSDLVYFLVIFFILLAGFTVTMHAMFRRFHGYATLGESFLTLFLVSPYYIAPSVN